MNQFLYEFVNYTNRQKQSNHKNRVITKSLFKSRETILFLQKTFFKLTFTGFPDCAAETAES